MAKTSFFWSLLELGGSGSGRARGALRVWPLVELIETRIHPTREARAGGLLRWRLHRHRGAELRLQDGTTVRRDDPLLELHMDNQVILRQLSSGRWTPWQAIEECRRDLAVLAATPELSAVKALHGRTVLRSGARRLGFELRPLSSDLRSRLEGFFLVGLEAVYNPEGTARLRRGRLRHRPAEIWMSAARLRRLPSD